MRCLFYGNKCHSQPPLLTGFRDEGGEGWSDVGLFTNRAPQTWQSHFEEHDSRKARQMTGIGVRSRHPVRGAGYPAFLTDSRRKRYLPTLTTLSAAEMIS